MMFLSEKPSRITQCYVFGFWGVREKFCCKVEIEIVEVMGVSDFELYKGHVHTLEAELWFRLYLPNKR